MAQTTKIISLIVVLSVLFIAGCGDRSQKSKTKLTESQALEHFLKNESDLKHTGWRFYATQKKASGLYAYLIFSQDMDSSMAPVESELRRLCPDKKLHSFWQDTGLEAFDIILLKDVQADKGKAKRLVQITCDSDFDRVAFENGVSKRPAPDPILDVESDRQDWYEKIMDALRDDDPTAVNLLLDERPQYIDMRNDRGESLLHFCKSGATASLLLEKGANVNAKTTWGATPLIYAADFTETDFAAVLISAGADVNYMDGHSNTPLKLAKNEAIAKFLVENGAMVPDDALITPAGQGRLEVMKYLYNKGARVNGKNAYGETALLRTALNSGTSSSKIFSTVAEWLLQHGAEVNVLSKAGKTPYDLAMQRKPQNQEMLEVLSKYGGKPAERIDQ